MTERIQRDPGIEHAVIAAGGSFRALAEKLGMHTQSVVSWKRIPAERVLEIERAIPGTDRHVMRPDLYPREAE